MSALPEFYLAQNCILLLTFRHNVSVPTLRVRQSKKILLGLLLISQRSVDLIHTMAEVGNLAKYCVINEFLLPI